MTFRSRSGQHDPASEKFEIIDIASKRSLGVHTLSQGDTKVRMWGFNLDPKERFAVLLVKAYTKKTDRYEVSRPTLLKYDIARHVVTDTIPWPKGEEREGAQIIFAPSGDLMYFFTTDDVLVYDTQTLKVVDRWDINRTLFEEGMGRIGAGFQNDIYEEPGFYTSLFRSTDPVNRRTTMGVARIDLVNRQLDFHSLGPSNNVTFRLAPGRTKRVRHSLRGRQLSVLDVRSRRQARGEQGGVQGSAANGNAGEHEREQLYITTAGPTIDRYSASDFRHLGTVNLGADMTNVILIPRAAGQR